MKKSSSIDLKKRAMAKTGAWLLVTASLGRPSAVRALIGSSDGPGEKISPPPWGDPSTLVSAIGVGSLSVASVAETVDAYVNGFGYIERWRGRIPAQMAEFWDVPAMANREAAVVGPPEIDNGLIRIFDLGDDFQTIDYRKTLGWLALEIRVRSPDAVVSRLEGLPFVHTGGPGDFTLKGVPIFRAAQFKGPSGESLYLTQDLQYDRSGLIGPNNVGPLFIQTLNAKPYQQTRDFYLNTLAMKMSMEIDMTRQSAGERPDVPEERSYKMAAVRAPDYCSIQIDEFPDTAPHRPAAPGCFSSGVSMCTFTTRDLDVVADALTAAEIPYLQIAETTIPPFSGSRAIVCTGHSGETIEFVDVRPS